MLCNRWVPVMIMGMGRVPYLRARNLFLISRKFPLPMSILKGSLMMANLNKKN
jgi:hypothetical protein